MDSVADAPVVLRVGSDRYTPEDPTWQADVEGLVREVRELADGADEGRAIRIAVAPGGGVAPSDTRASKGGVVETVVTVVPVVVPSLALLLREWQRHDSGRRVTVERSHPDGSSTRVDISGRVPREVIEEALRPPADDA